MARIGSEIPSYHMRQSSTATAVTVIEVTSRCLRNIGLSLVGVPYDVQGFPFEVAMFMTEESRYSCGGLQLAKHLKHRRP